MNHTQSRNRAAKELLQGATAIAPRERDLKLEHRKLIFRIGSFGSLQATCRSWRVRLDKRFGE